jgi:hypothetical protein
VTKTHILDEIRRTAAANGGEPLGWRRFETETGIRKTDWAKFWARWGDAIRETGLSPNAFISAYDNATLLDFVAQLTREMKRVPAWSDLKLKAHNDPAFPSDTVFRRFGAKPDLVKQLAAHCRGKGGYDDVIRLCDAYVPRRRGESDQEEAATPVAGEIVGFVYLMKSGRFYKIGMSNSAGRREYELGIQMPEPVTLVHTIRTDDPVGIEAYWHNRFAAKRKKGEWFELDAADVAVFKRRKFM